MNISNENKESKMNMLDTVRNNKKVITSVGFGIIGAALLVGVYKAGSYQAGKAYVSQINNLTKKVANTQAQPIQPVEPKEEPVNAQAKPEPKVKEHKVKSTETISAPVAPVAAVVPVSPTPGKIGNFQVQGRIPVTEISNDLTSDIYTTPGISLEDAEALINGDMTVGKGTRFPTPKEGLWAAGRMMSGNENNEEFHRKAVEAAKAAKETKATIVVEPDLVEAKTTKKRKDIRQKNRAATAAKKHPMGESDI